MRKVSALTAALLLVVGLAGAWAGEIEGKITAVDTDARMIQLDYNTDIAVAEGVPMDRLKEGANVKASYEERGGKKIATRVEVMQ
jgi:Cu/Ag efflux protein CusF